MRKKKLLEFGLKEADAFQKNFKIIFDRLVRGYRSMMGKEPEGLDLLKVKMEARQKALDTTKVVNQKGLTLDPDKPIVGGTQEGIETIKIKELDVDDKGLTDSPLGDLKRIIEESGGTAKTRDEVLRDEMLKGPRPFGDNIRDAYSKAGRSREDASEMIEALDSPGAKKSYEIMEEALGVRLYGDETFDELMQIKETGVHPRGEPPIKKAYGGRVGFSRGGESIIGSDIGMIGGLMGAPTTEEDEFADIQGQTAGIGLSSLLTKMFGPTVGKFLHGQVKKKAMDKITDIAQKRKRDEAVEQAQRNTTAAMAAANRAAGRGGYQSSFGRDAGFMGGSGTAAEMGSFADGGLASMFVEKR